MSALASASCEYRSRVHQSWQPCSVLPTHFLYCIRCIGFVTFVPQQNKLLHMHVADQIRCLANARLRQCRGMRSNDVGQRDSKNMFDFKHVSVSSYAFAYFEIDVITSSGGNCRFGGCVRRAAVLHANRSDGGRRLVHATQLDQPWLFRVVFTFL